MQDLFHNTDYGKNVELVVSDENCSVMHMRDESGTGMMTVYRVFPGVFLMVNDFHMRECESGFQTGLDMLCIDHCREGRIEMEVEDNAYSYLSAGELRVDRRLKHSGHVSLPLCHYHGIGITFIMDIAAPALSEQIKDFPVDLYRLQKKYCPDHNPFVIPADPTVEHLFSELYQVPSVIRKDYFRIKVFELLLYLDALELPEQREEHPYFFKNQVEKIKAIQALLTEDLTRHYTIEALAKRYDIAMTPLKNCFKSVYGSPIFSYMRSYRMNAAAALLKQRSDMSVAEIAGLVGYDSPSKFASAFKQVMGKAPLEYRKSIV